MSSIKKNKKNWPLYKKTKFRNSRSCSQFAIEKYCPLKCKKKLPSAVLESTRLFLSAVPESTRHYLNAVQGYNFILSIRISNTQRYLDLSRTVFMTCHGQHRATIIHHLSRTAQSYHHPSPVQDSTELPSSLTCPGQNRVTIIPHLSRTTQVDVSLIRDSVSITLRNTAKCDELHTATQECQTMLHSICDSNIRNDIRLSA